MPIGESVARLEVIGVTKRFPGTLAVSFAEEQSLTFDAGEIHALVGENGAGKSTLASMIAGLNQPTSGHLRLDGREFRPRDILDAQATGVSIVPQSSLLVPNMSVTENVTLGRQREFARFGFVVKRRRAALAEQALAEVGADVDGDLLSADLSREDQKFVELARALQRGPRVLVVDEMTEALSRPRIEQLFARLRAFADRGGLVIYVSHLLEEIFELCQRVSVMKDGTPVATKLTRDTDEDELATLMVGRAVAQALPRRAAHAAPRTEPPVLVARGLERGDRFAGVSLEVRPGEVLGIGGLVGCGKEALVRALSGDEPASGGELLVHGRPVRLRSPKAAISAGIAYVPGDRDRDGLILDATIRNNVVLPSQRRLARGGLTRPGRETRAVEALIERLQIKCRGALDLPLNLSGGNRQKVVLAKWILSDSDLLILENPTHGIDVGAKAEIYDFVHELTEQRLAILLVTDELPELTRLSDRILVMRRGAVAFETDAETEVSEELLIRHML